MKLQKSNLSPKKSKELYYNSSFGIVFNLEEMLQQYFKLETPISLSFIHHSDLHLTLNKHVEKQNSMIDGKYKRARLYLFETENFYLAATCETGNRGSSLAFTTKNSKDLPKVDLLRPNRVFHDLNLELTEAILDYCYILVENNSKFKQELLTDYPIFAEAFLLKYSAEKERELLAAELPEQPNKNKIKM